MRDANREIRIENLACENMRCRHRDAGSRACTLPSIEIDERGRCASQQKGVGFYIGLVLDQLESSNFIDALRLDSKMRCAIFITTDVFRLQYATASWGNCDMLTLHACGRTVMKEGREPIDPDRALRVEDLQGIRMDADRLARWSRVVDETPDEELLETLARLSGTNDDGDGGKDADADGDKDPFPHAGKLGWISPRGKFTEADFGDHDAAAEAIVEAKGWTDDCEAWLEERRRKDRVADTARGYLISKRRYVLLHDPTCTGPIATEPYTKSQREFLYEWFSRAGNRIRAERYLR